ncbi:MAG: hypothetical protein C5B60_07815 [Chloroflexi bacterium]|nr:MAG: hypothetical protein C5B60_07815 [Chloroflexota bacterium]
MTKRKPITPNGGTCSLCGGPYTGYGHNPQPLRHAYEDRCCDTCNTTRVIPARWANYAKWLENPDGPQAA